MATKKKVFWESLIHWGGVSSDFFELSRAKVPGGWLFALRQRSHDNASITFYPDPIHEWDGGSLSRDAVAS